MVSGSAGHLGEALMRTLELLDHWDGNRGTTSPAIIELLGDSDEFRSPLARSVGAHKGLS